MWTDHDEKPLVDRKLFATTTVTPIPSDATRPSVEAFTAISSYSGTRLDKAKSNWEDWKHAVYTETSLTGMWDYIAGEEERPDKNLEPFAYRNWSSNCRKTTGYLYGSLSRAELKACPEPTRGTHPSVWFQTLTKRHTSVKTSDEVRLVQSILTMPREVEDGYDLLEHVEWIVETVRRAWDKKHLTGDTLTFALLFDSLTASGFDQLKTELQERLDNASDAAPFDSRDIYPFVRAYVRSNEL